VSQLGPKNYEITFLKFIKAGYFEEDFIFLTFAVCSSGAHQNRIFCRRWLFFEFSQYFLNLQHRRL
jgi:hypothetical protein